MNTTLTMDEVNQNCQDLPGAQLARLREQKGFSQEYVAARLHLRVRLIQLLEEDRYEEMPEAVFIKGYLRAYAKLLGISPDPFLKIYNQMFQTERKIEKALWQPRRRANYKQIFVRWLTILIVLAAVVSISLWWQTNKFNHHADISTPAIAEASNEANAMETHLTDLSKMQSMFSSSEEAQEEVQGG